MSKLRRFYKAAAPAVLEGGFGVTLDGKAIRTPAKALLAVPNRALAEAIADEWRRQGQTIEPNAMRLTRMANAAIDRVPGAREAVIEEILGFGGSDLVCYRAERPIELVRRQNAAWEPLLAWLEAFHGARLQVTAGIVPTEQNPEALARLREVIAAMDDLTLTALHTATAACGSLVIALALAHGRLTAVDAFRLSRIDEAFQAEQWGDVEEARAREAEIAEDIASAARFMELCRA